MSFVHLHTHTQYSMLDSTIRIEDLVARAVEDGAPAVAMTDHDNLFGAVELYKAAQKAGKKAILGAEVGVVDGDRRDPALRRTGTIVLLAKDQEGYRNLCYLLSRGYMDAPPRAPGPRIDRALLAERAGGLVALSGSLSGEIPQAILRGQLDDARALARRYAGLFKGDFYLEVVRSGIKEQERVEQGLLHLSEELGIPLVAGADAHYARREDASAHEVLMCIQMGKSLPNLETKARLTDLLHLAPAEEMIERFRDLPEAVRSTLEIAERCTLELRLGKSEFPSYAVPEGHDAASFLRDRARDGLARRLDEARSRGQDLDRAAYEARLEFELGVIEKMGFPSYFLVVWDFIRYAKEHGIPVGPGRGSGAGSLVAWSLRITDIDPIRYSLLFERFLNPERVSNPDFDIDFCMNERDRVIRYVTEKYGEDQVGQIITYGTMKAKAVIRDVSRVLGLTFAEADRAAKLVPERLDMDLEKAFAEEPRLRELEQSDPRYARLFAEARKLEGLNRQPGMHAAGVVIGDKPLWEYVPLYAVRDDQGNVVRVTQYAKDEVELAGLVKFDFLGLKTLTVVAHAVRLVDETRARRGEPPFDLSAIPLDDRKVFDLIGEANTTGIFQMESTGFKEMVRKLKPDTFEDIVAAVAIYRPGPLQSGMVDSFIRRKNKEEKVEYPHPWLEDCLKETYGVMVYQEQVMQAASVLAGFTLGQADLLRRAMGKKKPEEMAKQREVFRAGAAAKGVDPNQADAIFETIEKFAGYGFNKSHSAAYGLVSYQTAWLKAHHPVEFMAALLTCDGDNTDKVVRLIAEARSMGITVLPPSVNASAHDFTVDGGAIRFGLGAVKGIGQGAVESILDARRAAGPFRSLFDFCERVDLRRANRKVLEALTKCGAFDDFGLPRMTTFEGLEKAMERGTSMQRDRESGQFNLFGDLEPVRPAAPPGEAEAPSLVPGEEWPDKLRLAYEKECLGFYVSGHPLDRYKAEVDRQRATPLGELGQVGHGTDIRIAGVVSALRERPLKSGDGRMAFVTLEDPTGQVEMLVFSKVYAEAEVAVKGDAPLLVEATVQVEGEGEAETQRLRVRSIRTLASIRESETRFVRLHVARPDLDADRMVLLQDLLRSRTEGLPVELVLSFPDEGRAFIQLGREYRMPPDDDFVHRVERLVGRDRVAFV